MYTIAKRFEFAAAHRLDHLPESHKCHRQHGHNYSVEIILQSETLDERGFVVDYGDLSLFRDYIQLNLDHRDLNEVFGFQTTAENLAKHLYDVAKARFPQTVAVRVSETPNTWAEYRGWDGLPNGA